MTIDTTILVEVLTMLAVIASILGVIVVWAWLAAKFVVEGPRWLGGLLAVGLFLALFFVIGIDTYHIRLASKQAEVGRATTSAPAQEIEP